MFRSRDIIVDDEKYNLGVNDQKDVERQQGDISRVVSASSRIKTIDGGVVVDGVWGTLEEGAPNYRGLGWIRASVLLVKVQIGLGVLSIPAALDALGLVPAILVIVAVCLVITWADYIVGVFKLHHPEVYTLAEVGQIMFGPIGREIFGFFYWIQLVAIAGAGLLTCSVAFNALSEHGTCTIVFVVVAAVINILISSIQTLDRISWIGWIGVGGIISSIVTLTVAVAVQDRPSAAPQTGPWDKEVLIFNNPGFVLGISTLSNIIFSFAGTPNFFNVIAEMKNPRDYNKAMGICQTFVLSCYLILGCTIYHFCGEYIASPALGSAGPLMKKVCYGLALPGLIVSAVLNTHLPAKYVFVRVMRNSRHLSANTITHRVVWVSCVIGSCVTSFVIAEGIPVFSDLISLIGALIATPNCIVFEGMMFIYDLRINPDKYPNRNKWWHKGLEVMNWVVMIGLGLFATVAGTYAAAVTIRADVSAGSTTQPFSCADNSG
ncbi:hypothetical protein L202_04638 [Cryptococcus amylolentus CBS 6039]|uniref:Amino acid transporter transmembrane domain-containing protein n=1 Tax=Cryptococcus amylolentus CBS 6039 TaxID=1295533 RepID=A0A1E3HPU2_9TREE|nr:hypothetical protein L202_04638 [Cryptococcus amylolentus CBS 6039]ODN77461.1 hypothetical protein L202_04638 [Cryptococcus amylolentus CBS 6039]